MTGEEARFGFREQQNISFGNPGVFNPGIIDGGHEISMSEYDYGKKSRGNGRIVPSAQSRIIHFCWDRTVVPSRIVPGNGTVANGVILGCCGNGKKKKQIKKRENSLHTMIV